MHLRNFKHVMDAIDDHFSYAYQSERQLMCEVWKRTRDTRLRGDRAEAPHRCLDEGAHKHPDQ